MKKALLQKKTEKKLREAGRHKVPGFDHAQKVGVLFTLSTKKHYDETKEFVRILKDCGKQVKTLAFKPKNSENFELFFDFFTEKDFNFWGKPVSENVVDFLDNPFDYLFCLDDQLHEFTAFMLAHSKAKSRIGIYDSQNDPFFEFMVGKTPHAEKVNYSEQMLNYLQKITHYEA